MKAISSHRRWSLVPFVGGLGLAFVAVVQAAQSVRQHRATSARLVRDYGAFAAWSFREHVAGEVVDMMREWLTPVVHATAKRPAGTITAATWREEARTHAASDACDSSCYPRYHFRLPLVGAPQIVFAGSTQGTEIDALVTAVRAHAAGLDRPSGDFAVATWREGAVTRRVAYAIAGAGEAVAFGFELDPTRFRPVLEEVFREGELLPKVVTEGRPNATLLAVAVVDSQAVSYFTSREPVDWIEPSVESLGPQLAGLQVRAGIRRAMLGPLTGGTLTRARLPLVGGLLALSCLLAIMAIYQLRRETELSRMRTDFVSSVSHELRTPLTQIQLFLETLRLGRHKTDAQREWILGNMQREVTRLTGLVDNVLHFSRGERGDAAGARELTRLDTQIGQIVRDFQPLAAVRDVSLVTDLEPAVFAHLHASFRQVVLNLLDNALKYGPEGQTIRVALRRVDGIARLTVLDEGPGVPPEERTLVFEPFQRGERAVGSAAAGSGIGLSVVEEIVAAHGGRVSIDDAPGGGARVVVEISTSGVTALPVDPPVLPSGEVG